MGENYQVLPGYKRFNQKNNTILRSSWDPELLDFFPRSKESIKKHIEAGDPGFTHLDFAFNNGSSTVPMSLGTGINSPNSGLTSWEPLSDKYPRSFPVEAGKFEVKDPEEMQDRLRRLARFYGASMVGFTPLDERWVYSHHYLPQAGENPPVEIPEGCDQVIIMGVAMNFKLFSTAPTPVMTSETIMNYSRMSTLVSSMAEFIRALGYTAIPCLNDTALNVPLAVDAGLGQPSRLGVVITRKYGPRIRFCKVITDMPLEAVKKSADFGVIEFCEECQKCAEACPSGALPTGPRTTEGHNISNNPGVLKWYPNYERCRKYWAHVGTNCGICLRVCPFNEAEGFHHDIARWLIRLKIRPINRFLVWLHGVFGYGQQGSTDVFWKEAEMAPGEPLAREISGQDGRPREGNGGKPSSGDDGGGHPREETKPSAPARP